MKIRLIDIVVLIILILAIILVGATIKTKLYNYNYKQRISELTSDDIEVEKKWLIDKNNIKYDLSKARVYEIEQTYINFSPEIRVRRVNNNQFSFTVKSNMSDDGLIRDETDFLITENEYNSLIAKKEGNTIYKTRYKLYDDGQVIAIDIFKGDLDGLAYMEIEFASKEEAYNYKTPDWVIEDVTSDVRYKNSYLARYGIPNENEEVQIEEKEKLQNLDQNIVGL